MSAPGVGPKGRGVRKVLVCGAAIAATCISAVTVSGVAEATPPTPAPSSHTAPDPSGTPDLPSTTAPGTRTPDATETEQATPDPVVSTRAVMVTPEPPKVATFSYGPHKRHKIDVYSPSEDEEEATAGARRPAVLLLHGGSWVGGDKAGWKYFARKLTSEGFIVFSANYRLAQHAAWPAQRDDAMAALTFVKRNATRWNVDPQRVAAMGSSAGGLMTNQLATFGEGGTRIRGAVSLSPVNVPYLAYQGGLEPGATGSKRALKRAVVRLFRCEPLESDPACWAKVDDSNTVTHASEGDAPVMNLHFSDEFVPPSQSTGLAAALRGKGVRAETKVYPGKEHATKLLNVDGVTPTIIAWLKARTSN
jgi:acetyl esterase/lipase